MLRSNRSVHTVGFILALCTLLIAGCAGVSYNLGPLSLGTSTPRKGTLLYADQGVTITRGSQASVNYYPGMEVKIGDSIETTDGQAVIDYDDGSVVILNSRTRIQLGSITLFFGELFARVKSIATHGGGRVVTDELAASVEGTEYGVRRTSLSMESTLGKVQVYVREGHVLCSPGARAHWLPLTITKNQMFEVAGYRGAPATRVVDARSLSRWADEAERRLRKPRVPEKTRVPEVSPNIRAPILWIPRVPQHRREQSTDTGDDPR